MSDPVDRGGDRIADIVQCTAQILADLDFTIFDIVIGRKTIQIGNRNPFN